MMTLAFEPSALNAGRMLVYAEVVGRSLKKLLTERIIVINEEIAMEKIFQKSLSMIDLGEYFSWIAIGISVLAVLISSLMTLEKIRLKQVDADASSADSLYEELNYELNRAKTRRTTNQIAHKLLSLISIIGGILVSTVYFQDSFSKQIGTIGFLILVSSLLRLFFHPLENYQRAKRDVVFLKVAVRDYRGFDNHDKAATYLRKKLNEYDQLSLSE